MNSPQPHQVIGLFYSHAEAAQILGIARGTYTKACSLRNRQYDDYMRRLIAQLRKDIQHEISDKPRRTTHYPALFTAVVRTFGRPPVAGMDPLARDEQ